MRAGAHDRLVSIERKSVTHDATYGTEVVTWVTVLSRFRAELQDMLPSRSESVRQGLNTARNQTRMRMRWYDGITSDMRVILHADTDIVYQIVAGPAEIEGRKERIELMLERYSS